MNPLNTTDLGNDINRIIRNSLGALFTQSELAQLSYSAFEYFATVIKDAKDEEFNLTYPIGYSPSNKPLLGTYKYKKEELIGRYSFIANTQLAINGVYQIVTIVEAMLGDIIRAVLIKYPKKLGKNHSISTESILEVSTLEEVYMLAIDAKLYELSYKSARDFAIEAEKLISVNLLDCPSYHRYIETKATRDVYVHNRGIANKIYVAKSGSHARVDARKSLPIDTVYLLGAYEYCLQLAEWLELRLHDIWPSSYYEQNKHKITEKGKKNEGVDT